MVINIPYILLRSICEEVERKRDKAYQQINSILKNAVHGIKEPDANEFIAIQVNESLLEKLKTTATNNAQYLFEMQMINEEMLSAIKKSFDPAGEPSANQDFRQNNQKSSNNYNEQQQVFYIKSCIYQAMDNCIRLLNDEACPFNFKKHLDIQKTISLFIREKKNINGANTSYAGVSRQNGNPLVIIDIYDYISNPRDSYRFSEDIGVPISDVTGNFDGEIEEIIFVEVLYYMSIALVMYAGKSLPSNVIPMTDQEKLFRFNPFWFSIYKYLRENSI